MPRFLISFFLIPVFVEAQVSDFTKLLRIGPESPDKPEFVTMEIPDINSAVVFHWPAHTAGCPSSRVGDFILPKINPQPREYLFFKRLCNPTGDSIFINTSFVYEITTIHGARYYMSILSATETEAQVKITSSKPLSIHSKKIAQGHQPKSTYLVNGRENAGASANQKVYGEKPFTRHQRFDTGDESRGADFER